MKIYIYEIIFSILQPMPLFVIFFSVLDPKCNKKKRSITCNKKVNKVQTRTVSWTKCLNFKHMISIMHISYFSSIFHTQHYKIFKGVEEVYKSQRNFKFCKNTWKFELIICIRKLFFFSSFCTFQAQDLPFLFS